MSTNVCVSVLVITTKIICAFLFMQNCLLCFCFLSLTSFPPLTLLFPASCVSSLTPAELSLDFYKFHLLLLAAADFARAVTVKYVCHIRNGMFEAGLF